MRNTAAWGLWCVALVGVLVSHPRAQAPSGALTTLPAHGQVSLIASAAGNSVVQVGPQGVLVVDTGAVFGGPPIGTNTTGQEAEGPHCVGSEGGHH